MATNYAHNLMSDARVWPELVLINRKVGKQNRVLRH